MRGNIYNAAAISITGLFLTACSAIDTRVQNDWEQYSVPASLPSDMQWQLLPEYSDNFNYSGKTSEYHQKWQSNYMNEWKGPGLTEWRQDHSSVEDGNLIIHASRKQGTEKVHAGIVTSQTEVKYPVYIEANIKVANQVLSSNIWMLSNDSKRELDILEIYGSDRPDHTYFATHASNNYHIFLRDEETNEILQDFRKQHKVAQDNNAPYRLDYHRYGAYWKDAWNVDFYIDGKLVRELRRQDIEDPNNTGLYSAMYIIMDLEDHDWRSKKGHVASDQELADASKNKMYVDWIRTYRPVSQ